MKFKRANHRTTIDQIPILRSFLICIVTLTLVAYFAADYARELLHLSYPFSSPFFQSVDFTDLYTFRHRFVHYHHLDFFSLAKSRSTVFSYPPPMGLLYAFFYWPGSHIHAFFVLITTPPLIGLMVLLGRAMVKRGLTEKHALAFLFAVCLTSYPFWVNYYLGNLEVVIAIITAVALLAFVRRHYYLSAVLIGVAGSMKLFPFVLLGLFLSQKRFRAIVLSLVTGAATFIGATWMECPSFSVARQGMNEGANAMGSALVLRWMRLEDGMDHSLFSLVKRIVHKHYETEYKGVFLLPHWYLSIYLAVAGIAGLALYFRYVRLLPVLNQILFLSVAAVLLPPLSHDYTLMHLYVPWAFLTLLAIEAAQARRVIPGLKAAFICFALLFSPLTELVWRGSSLDGQIKAVVLLAIGFVSIRYPFTFAANSLSAKTEFNAPDAWGAGL